MTTETISLGEFKKNTSHFIRKGRDKKIKYVILMRGKPAFEVNPIENNTDEDDDWDVQYTPENHKAYLEALEEEKRGEILTIDFDKVKTYDDFMELIRKDLGDTE